MKIFELTWLLIAGLSFIFGIYKLTMSKEHTENGYFLFLLTALCLFMWFIKRKSRFMLKNDASKSSYIKSK